ncbi:MAG: hypothetical protein Q4G58_00730 [bacterium]|nr:hypothetical protein [bacterium]
MKFHSTIAKNIFMFLLGGFCYGCIEMLYKGNTHISMIIAGGICFFVIGQLNRWRGNPSLLGEMVVSALVITAVEFITGLIVNVWLDLYVWDYSGLPYNVMGQICLLFSVLWFLLSLVAILFDDAIRYFLLGEPKRHYHLL